MKHLNNPKFLKTLIMLLVVTGLNVACVSIWPVQPLVAAPIPSSPSIEPVEPVATTKTLGIQTKRGLQFTLEDKTIVLFEFDKADLLPEGQKEVEKIAQVIQEQYSSRSIVVEGHTDSIGREEYNQTLSERRANAVREALIASGIKPEKIVARAFGENNPVASNETEEGQQQNRRVEITILNEGATP